jgi:hypothetical protein|tara:strand:+ start:217 stop:519 length:303 start_codon:yes stop_codon:yes gene_type:complete
MKIHNEHLLGKLSLSLVSSLLIPLGWIQYYFSSNPFSKPDGKIVNVEDLFLAVLVNLILITQLVFFSGYWNKRKRAVWPIVLLWLILIWVLLNTTFLILK